MFRLILRDYLTEGLTMSYTMEDLRRDAAREFLDELPPEERIKGLTLDDILQSLNAEQKSRLRQLLMGGENRSQ